MKLGFYVEGIHYGIRLAQAQARAQHLANTYGRPIEVRERSPLTAGLPSVVHVAHPITQQVAA